MSRFKKKQDCYLDTKTNLEWSLNNINPLPWEEAAKSCKSLGKGWRLPFVQELLTLVDYGRHNLATELPEMLSSHYWSSTPYAVSTVYAWLVNFYNGDLNCYSKSYDHYVRAVRGGTK